ncbi:MAG: cbb3-type cytochrome oxidase assembly protein CcoS [Balneolaceae bacterium]|nr:cbb3-type cytochrome oxidase assembly protein CcoS [Balneolaceae bacterium]
MEVIFLLIGFSLFVALLFLGLFFWAVKSGQYDDSYTPSMRMLFDEKKTSNKNHQETKNRDV